MFIVDRNQFISWTQGILMDRHNDNVLVVNSTKCQEVKNKLDMGEKIGLTINGELITTMIMTDEGYIEDLI
jgi:hypothetical protein